MTSTDKLACDEIAAHPFWNTFQKYQRWGLAFDFKPTTLEQDVESFFYREMQATWRRFQAEYPVMLARDAAHEIKLRAAFAHAVIAANTRDPQGYSRPQTFHVHGQELALIPDDEAQFEEALNVVHLEHKGRVR